MDRRGTSVVLTYVPTPRPLAGGPALFADLLNVPLVATHPAGLLTQDDDHLDESSAIAWSEAVRAGTGARDSVNFVSWSFAALFAVVFFARLTIGTRKIEPAYVAVLHGRQRDLLRLAHPDLPGHPAVQFGVDYWAALWLVRIPLDSPGRSGGWCSRCRWAPISACSAFFKYANFLDADRRETSVGPSALARLPPEFLVALPMGISFYTFQSMSLHHRRLPRAAAGADPQLPRRSSCSSASSRNWSPARSSAPSSSCRRCRARGGCASAGVLRGHVAASSTASS